VCVVARDVDNTAFVFSGEAQGQGVPEHVGIAPDLSQRVQKNTENAEVSIFKQDH